MTAFDLVDKLGNTVALDGALSLHIGGTVKHPDWLIIDALDRDNVDIIADCRDLSMFPDGSCKAIYSSHVLEHVSYQGDLEKTLKGFRRILRDDGTCYVSVPNLKTLCQLFLNDQLTPEERRHVMYMMYGGQLDGHDFHKVGFDVDLLASALAAVGFTRLQVCDSFGLFQDSSEMVFAGTRISLNVIAKP